MEINKKPKVIHICFGLAKMSRYLIEFWKDFSMAQTPHKSVVRNKQRMYAVNIAKLWLGKSAMPKQAKTFTEQELRKVLDYIATRPHALRNRVMLFTTYYAGLRVGEVASLRYEDVVDDSGEIRDEILLQAEQTKGNCARVVFVNAKLKRELKAYICQYPYTKAKSKLFYSQKREEQGFTANTLTQHFHYLYKRAGMVGASSHSGRRTFITNLAAKGVGVRVLMSLAGHRNIGTTQAYIDVNDDMKRRAVELV
jgi:integrase/recombinase XerD